MQTGDDRFMQKRVDIIGSGLPEVRNLHIAAKLGKLIDQNTIKTHGQ